MLRLERERTVSEGRATEAEELRDALGRRVDVLEAANRCARALGSSLVIEEAFGAFIREVRGLVAFDRIAVVLVEGDRLEVLATAGEGARKIFPPGSSRPIDGSIFETLSAGRTVYRHDMLDRLHPEETALLELGLRSRLTAPLLVGSTAVGLISFVRREPDAFSAGGRARLADRQARGDCGAEHPRVRRRAPTVEELRRSPRCARTSSRSSPTSCAARWLP